MEETGCKIICGATTSLAVKLNLLNTEFFLETYWRARKGMPGGGGGDRLYLRVLSYTVTINLLLQGGYSCYHLLNLKKKTR